jgi:hypothetical protein
MILHIPVQIRRLRCFFCRLLRSLSDALLLQNSQERALKRLVQKLLHCLKVDLSRPREQNDWHGHESSDVGPRQGFEVPPPVSLAAARVGLKSRGLLCCSCCARRGLKARSALPTVSHLALRSPKPRRLVPGSTSVILVSKY